MFLGRADSADFGCNDLCTALLCCCALSSATDYARDIGGGNRKLGFALAIIFAVATIAICVSLAQTHRVVYDPWGNPLIINYIRYVPIVAVVGGLLCLGTLAGIAAQSKRTNARQPQSAYSFPTAPPSYSASVHS